MQRSTFPGVGINLDWQPQNGDARSAFVDIFPILADLWDKGIKGAATPRFKLRFVEKAEAQGSLFLAARFGLYSSDEYYASSCAKDFMGKHWLYDAAFQETGWPGDFQSLLGLTTSYCRLTRQHVHSQRLLSAEP